MNVIILIYRAGDPLWGVCTLACVGMPMIVSGLFSIIGMRKKRTILENEIDDLKVGRNILVNTMT